MPSKQSKRPRFKIVQTKEKEVVKSLHYLLFPDAPWEEPDASWLVYDSKKYYPVGFACVRRNRSNKKWAILSRVGVLEEARGHNLQQRLIQIREDWARRKKYKGLTTYVANWNSASLTNLLKSGFTVFETSDEGFINLAKVF